MVTNAARFVRGMRVSLPFGGNLVVEGSVMEVWGDAAAPTHVRVLLDDLYPDIEPMSVLADPESLTVLTLAS